MELNDIGVLKNNILKMVLPYGTNMGGGAIFITREKFENSGGEDESFYGWGPEDWNRIEKWTQLGYRIERVKGPLFHLTHPRDLNGCHNSEWQKRYAYNILRKTTYGNMDDIRKGIKFVPNSKLLFKNKLHIGCGKCILPQWLNTDINPYTDDVLFFDITKPFPFIDASFKYIFAEHVVEHITFDEFLSTLREIFRVLMPGGVFRIATPALEFLIDLYNNSTNVNNSKYINWSIENFASNTIKSANYKIQDLAIITFNNLMHNWGHQFIYNAAILETTLLMIGFKNVKRCSVGESLHEALRNLEQHGTQIPEWANELETIVFEAEK